MTNVIDFQAAVRSRALRAEAGSGSYNRAKAKLESLGIPVGPETARSKFMREYQARIDAFARGGTRALGAELVRQGKPNPFSEADHASHDRMTARRQHRQS